MSHPNALLAERGRLQLAKCVVDDGWPLGAELRVHAVLLLADAAWWNGRLPLAIEVGEP